MRRIAVAIFVLLSSFVTSLGHSQTSAVWFTLNAPEGSVITASAPITLRYGQVASTCAYNLAPGLCYGVPIGTPTPETWTSPQTFSPPSGSSTVSVTVNNGTFGGDPLPGVYKTVEIQEQSTAQTITVNGQSVTVPASSNSSPSASPTVWFTLNAPEGTVITASATITLRYGQVASTCAYNLAPGLCYGVPIGTPTPETWTSPQTFSPSGSSTVSVTVNNNTFGGDPLPGVYKTVQIQEQTTSQTISVNGQSVTVPAAGSSTCQLTANPGVITFQNTTVGYTLASSGSLTSNCSSTISVSAIQVSGSYSVSGVQAPFSIAPNQTQNYSVVFAPVSAGAASGTIYFVNSANSGVSVALSGTGVAAPQSPSPTVHSVTLSWDASTSQVSGYNVYRSVTSGSGYALLNSSPITTTSFTDGAVTAGATYYYVVTAIDASGLESTDSNEVGVTIPTP